MNKTFKFKAVTYRGEKISFLYKIDCPDGDIDLIDWLDSQDKQHIIDEKELSCIVDYEIYVKKPRVKNIAIKKENIELQAEKEDLFSKLQKILR